MPVRLTRCRKIALALTLLVLATAPHRAAAQGASYEQLQTFSSLINQIRLSYVDSVTYADLVHAAIDGVLSSLDPHSRFERRVDAEREMAYESGALAGTGLYLDVVDDQVAVLAVQPRSPAARAGVSPGDRLLSINDTSVSGLTSQEAGGRLIGDKGKKVRLMFARGTRLEPDSVPVTLKLDFLKPVAITAQRMVDPTTGYIRFAEFTLKGGEELEKAVGDLRGQGAKRLMLDLRGNPGGFLIAAEEIAGLFLPKDALIYRTDARRPSARSELRNRRDGKFRELPLIVLIDNGSASASEAVAATLQDHDRALLLGRRSFGKALVQQPFPLPPQGDMVWLTVARIVTPSGRIIQRSYRGLKAAQYYSFAGKSGAEADTTEVFHTERGRAVRGGGGIAPDVALPATATLPIWWAAAVDSGWYEAVPDSVAGLLPKDRARRLDWFDARADWQTRLVAPLLDRVRARLSIAARPDSSLTARLGRILAHRAAEVRWGDDAGDEFMLHNDPDIQAAMGYWDRLPALLGGAAGK
ncbi:MAG: S41 family peptidase [Gemmatimonadota bacterium]